MHLVGRAGGLAVLALAVHVAPAQAAPRYVAVQIAKFSQSNYVTAAPGDDRRIFVVSQPGRIHVLRDGKPLKRPFLDITGRVDSAQQRGLLGMAFAPDYARSRRFYVVYVTKADTVQLDEMRRARRSPNRAARTRRAVLNAGHAGDFHHGGHLAFGPDGLLFMSTGVSDRPALAQDLGDLHGKLLRIDPRTAGAPYRVPPDNPFVGVSGARPEIWAYGLRNPWRFSFDRRTGDLALGDVGEHAQEEIDFLPRGSGGGANFGFNVFEGSAQMIPGPLPERYVPPVISHGHRQAYNGICAVIGGYVVRDRRLRGLYGRYLYHDLCHQNYRSALLSAGRARGDGIVKGLRVPQTVSFGEDNRGRLYAATLGGRVFRIDPARR